MAKAVPKDVRGGADVKECGRFDVLSRHCDVRKSALVEASAGTGKTFAIEHVVTRLLIEECGTSPPTLEEILVVTFTRAATKQLVERIRGNILSGMRDLDAPTQKYDYLAAVVERGVEARRIAKRRLGAALRFFDKAPVFTIHSFAARTLKECGGLLREEPDWEELSRAVVRDSLRYDIAEDSFSPTEMQILLAKHDTVASIEKAIQKIITSGVPVQEPVAISYLVERFQSAVQALQKRFPRTGERLQEDFFAVAPDYKEICDARGVVKASVAEKVKRFTALFDKKQVGREDFEVLMEDGVVYEMLLPSRRKARVRKEAPPCDTAFVEAITEALSPFVVQAKDYRTILQKVAYRAQERLLRATEEEEVSGPDGLLARLSKALDDTAFLQQIQKRYRVAIVDEFQDTDRVQWDILRRLFLRDDKTLFLVGDPKQAIYGFRAADVYTYFSATEAMERSVTLDTNFRSQGPLVEAVQALVEHCPGFVLLPALKKELPVQPVSASKQTQKKTFSDGKAALQVVVVEGQASRSNKWPTEEVEREKLFPYIAEEIVRLVESDGVAMKDIAVLVKDRYQAERITGFLRECGIKASSRRGVSCSDSYLFMELHQILTAALSPNDESAVKGALSTRLLGWRPQDILALQDGENNDAGEVWRVFQGLHDALERGVADFAEALLACRFFQGETVGARLRARSQEDYAVLLGLVDLLVEYQRKNRWVGRGLKRFFSEKQKEEAQISNPYSADKDEVDIVTLHASKGLEWGVVFALGVASRQPVDDRLIKTSGTEEVSWQAVSDADVRLQAYHEEMDAEKLRQLYVAITRAKWRTYLAIVTGGDAPDKGSAAAEIFFARLTSDRMLSYQDLSETVGTLDAAGVKKAVDRVKGTTTIDVCVLDSSLSPPKHLAKVEEIAIVPPEPFVMAGKRHSHPIVSFSSLVVKAPHEPHDVLEPSADDLPAGSDVGVQLHELLQKVPWEGLRELTNPKDFAELLHAVPGVWPLKEPLKGYEEAVACLLYNVVKTPLRVGLHAFSLAEVSAEKLFREVEFYFPCRDVAFVGDAVRREEGYLKGFIDLLFEHNGLYYVVDWKSNRLASYDRSHLAEVVKEKGYDLQAKIYREACRRYLKNFDARPFDAIFGGVLVLFLRGMSPSQGSPMGVFHIEGC